MAEGGEKKPLFTNTGSDWAFLFIITRRRDSGCRTRYERHYEHYARYFPSDTQRRARSGVLPGTPMASEREEGWRGRLLGCSNPLGT